MDIVFLLSHIPNPRMNKRISISKEIGSTALISLDRQSYHIWDVQHNDIKNIVYKMNISDSQPIKRIFLTLIFAFKAIVQLLKMKPKCVYVGNIDMLLIAVFYSLIKKTNIIYEVADLNKIIIDNPNKINLRLLKRILIYTERKLCNRISCIILTSEKFYQFYYSKFIPKEKVIVIPNIPETTAFKTYKKKTYGTFTIGFIGGIRYIEQLKMMIKVAGRLNINVLIAGSAFNRKEEEDLKEYCNNKDFVQFTGRYNYNNDIADLYGKCDCIYSVYDADLNNVKIALPNKLYESIYCNLPIIVAKDTYLAELVENLGVGVAVSHKNPSELEEVLRKMIIDKNYYNSFVNACKLHKDKINIDIYNQKLSKKLIECVRA